MTPTQFLTKWKAVELSARAACQSHFLDLCRVLGQPAPTDAAPGCGRCGELLPAG